MPNRILRDGIIESERVNRLSQGAELFYRRLMSKADDFGRFHANLNLLLAACYPLQLDRVSLTNVREWLTECGEFPPLILEYSEQNKNYLVIMNFGQRTRSEKSKFPEPPPSIVSESPSSAARATSPPPYTSPKDELRTTSPKVFESEEIRKHAVVEALIRGLANQQPDPQDFEAGVDAAIREILSSANPDITVRTMKDNLPKWWEAMKDGRARIKPMRYVIVDKDYLRVPKAAKVAAEKKAAPNWRDPEEAAKYFKEMDKSL